MRSATCLTTATTPFVGCGGLMVPVMSTLPTLNLPTWLLTGISPQRASLSRVYSRSLALFPGWFAHGVLVCWCADSQNNNLLAHNGNTHVGTATPPLLHFISCATVTLAHKRSSFFKELYNVSSDPAQLVNIYAQASPELQLTLAAKLQQLYNCAGASCE